LKRGYIWNGFFFSCSICKSILLFCLHQILARIGYSHTKFGCEGYSTSLYFGSRSLITSPVVSKQVGKDSQFLFQDFFGAHFLFSQSLLLLVLLLLEVVPYRKMHLSVLFIDSLQYLSLVSFRGCLPVHSKNISTSPEITALQ
jgi:hypothetical protein